MGMGCLVVVLLTWVCVPRERLRQETNGLRTRHDHALRRHRHVGESGVGNKAGCVERLNANGLSQNGPSAV